MLDFQNMELLKVMWLPGEKEILFEVTTEISIPIDNEVYKILENFIDLNKWSNDYAMQYDAWLKNDDSIIYNINSCINSVMIEALKSANKIMSHTILFYWFDVDRTFIEGFNWQLCPISYEKLIEMKLCFPQINSLISPVYPLIFPKF